MLNAVLTGLLSLDSFAILFPQGFCLKSNYYPSSEVSEIVPFSVMLPAHNCAQVLKIHRSKYFQPLESLPTLSCRETIQAFVVLLLDFDVSRKTIQAFVVLLLDFTVSRNNSSFHRASSQLRRVEEQFKLSSCFFPTLPCRGTIQALVVLLLNFAVSRNKSIPLFHEFLVRWIFPNIFAPTESNLTFLTAG